MNRFDLETRLIDFSVAVINFTETLKPVFASKYLSSQIIRSSTSTALNYGEAQSGESKKDFIHKLQIVLKEFRETLVSLKILYKANLHKDEKTILYLLQENNELISIFVKSVQTIKSNILKS